MMLRRATIDDVHALVDVQEHGAIASLSHIFPQATYPFPRAEVLHRWRGEIADPQIHTYVSTDAAGRISGFAATRAAELLHFGTAVETWGSGLAQELHDAVLDELKATAPTGYIWLRVFEANMRARRFYERLGWTRSGRRTRTTFAPYPVLLEYRRP